MSDKITPTLMLPVGNFTKIVFPFGEKSVCDGKNWGTHLGVDIAIPAGTKIFSIGRGVVAYSRLHSGKTFSSGKILKRNWGGVVIVAHENKKTKNIFYSLYGHLGKRYVKKGDLVEIGEVLGAVGKSLSESNGMWEEEHLHLAIYCGTFKSGVLPGYYNETDKNTKLSDWREPMDFIKKYNSIIV